MSSASMMSSDGEDAMEADWTTEQEETLLTTYNAEIGTYSHQNPPFVPSAPPPALLSRVGKKVIRQAPRDSWPHTLAQTRKHLLLLVRRHAPEPNSPHVAPQQPITNRMSILTNDLPGYFSQSRGRPTSNSSSNGSAGNLTAASVAAAAASAAIASAAAFGADHSLNSPFDERSFNFDRPVSPRRTRMSSAATRSKSRDYGIRGAGAGGPTTPRRLNRADLMKEGSFGFGVPLTPTKDLQPPMQAQTGNDHGPTSQQGTPQGRASKVNGLVNGGSPASGRSNRSKTPTRRRHDLGSAAYASQGMSDGSSAVRSPGRRALDDTIDEGIEEPPAVATPTTRGRVRSSLEVTPTAGASSASASASGGGGGRQLDFLAEMTDGDEASSPVLAPTSLQSGAAAHGSPRRSSRIRDKSHLLA